ncbi:MAG: hypothetical protein PSX37_03315 [bacterium]|nr:hypothetical protein [bacterium]
MLSIRRAISIAGLDRAEGAPWSGGPRQQIDWALSLGVGAVQIDGTIAGLRARELDQSARRDLAAVLRRSGAMCSGLDIWVPAAHFVDAGQQDRAVDAITEACGLAADLRRLGAIDGLAVVSIATHETTPKHLMDRLALNAEHVGVTVADHRWPRTAESLGFGIDPAAVLLAGEDPSLVVSRTASRTGEPPAAARLSDLSAVGRCVAGRGRLKRDEYEVALTIAKFSGWLVIDLRGLPIQAEAAAELTA